MPNDTRDLAAAGLHPKLGALSLLSSFQWLWRYAVSGGLTTLIYIAVYNGALHLYSNGDPASITAPWVRFVCSNIGSVCALLFQYTAHGRFTFGHRKTKDGQLVRYLIAVGFGFLLAAGVSSGNHKFYVLNDGLVSVIVSFLYAISNFFFFNFWVYADDKFEN